MEPTDSHSFGKSKGRGLTGVGRSWQGLDFAVWAGDAWGVGECFQERLSAITQVQCLPGCIDFAEWARREFGERGRNKLRHLS